MDDRLSSQIQFLIEIDQLKEIQRRTWLISGNRLENSAEHSWHLAVMTLVLAEYSNAPIDTAKVLRMVILHDLVEIDAGDTFCYDAAANSTKVQRERLAADRLFGLLPPDQGRELRAAWEEFEACLTPEAKFAAALDRLMPVIHNLRNRGRGWRDHGVHSSQVLARNAPIADGAEPLWRWVKSELDHAIAQGILP